MVRVGRRSRAARARRAARPAGARGRLHLGRHPAVRRRGARRPARHLRLPRADPAGLPGAQPRPEHPRLRRLPVPRPARPGDRRHGPRAPARARPVHRARTSWSPCTGRSTRPSPLERALVETRAVLRRIEEGRLPARDPDASCPTRSSRRWPAGSTPLVGTVAEKVAGLEQRVMVDDFRHPEALLEEMFLVRHELLTVRTMAAQSHDIYGRMTALTGRAVAPDEPAAAGRPRPTSSTGSAASATARRSSCSASSSSTRPGSPPR